MSKLRGYESEDELHHESSIFDDVVSFLIWIIISIIVMAIYYD